MLTTLTTLWLFVLQTAGPLPAGWQDFSPKDGGFRVKMPGFPKDYTRKIEAGQDTIELRLWGIEQDGVTFIVSRTELQPEAIAGGPKKTLDEARDKGVQNSRGKLVEEKEIELAGHPGREMVLDLPDSRVRGGGIYRSRIYLVGRIHYQVVTLSPKALERPEEMKAFLESFRLGVETEQAPTLKLVIPHGESVEVWSAAYSPDGKTLVTSTSKGDLLLWNIANRPPSNRSLAPVGRQLSPVNKIAFAPDGKVFATANWDGTVKLWDLEGKVLAVLQGHKDRVMSVAFSPDGALLASGSWDKTAKIWDAVQRREIRTLPAQLEPVSAVAFSPDGKLLATGSGDWQTDNPGEVKLWDPATGKHLRNAWHSPREVKDLAFSPDGKRLAVARAASRAPIGDGAVTILSLENPAVPVTTLRCPTGATAVAFSPDSSLVAAGEWNGTLRLMGATPVSQRRSPGTSIDRAMIFDLVFSPDGKTFATANKDGTVKIWEVGQSSKTSR
jgi:hypothetical protein